jgi:hypothetical protein
MSQNAIKVMNRTKKERGKNKNAKNTNAIHKSTLQIEPRRTRGGIPAAIGSYTNSLICGPLSQENLRGGENLGKEEE